MLERTFGIKGDARPEPRLLAVLLMALVLLQGCALAPRGEPLAGRTVVITGASSGIGKATAIELANRGANVVLAARRTELLEQAAREAGGRTLVVTTDVSRPEDMERLASEAVAAFGRIDVWINNAAVGALGRFEDVPLEDHLRIIEVNVQGVIIGSRIALRHFREHGSGVLLNVGSVVGRVPFPYYSSYAASKSAVVGLGASLHQELRRSGVRDVHVVTVNPFATETPFFEQMANYSGRVPDMLWPDPPERVVAAIVRGITQPRRQINVGFKANAALASHRIARTLTEDLSGALIHRRQIKGAEAAAPRMGNVQCGADEDRPCPRPEEAPSEAKR
jgi:short-subunit dehydrogenase